MQQEATNLGTLDVIMQVISECVNQIDGVLACRSRFDVPCLKNCQKTPTLIKQTTANEQLIRKERPLQL